MSTFSQVSPQWYTSAGEEAERRVQQSCLLGRHLCSPGKHTICTTRLSTGSVYIHVYLSIYPSIIHLFAINHSVLSICVPIYLLLIHLSIYLPHHSGQVPGGSSAVQKSRAGGKGVALSSLTPHLPSHPHTLPSHPHTSPLTPHRPWRCSPTFVSLT